MCTETINETINVCKYVGYARETRVIDGEIVLQDIKPDILSIVKICREVCITQKRVENDKIRIDGTIDINILYIADDDLNSQRGASSKIDFSEVIALKGVDESSILKVKYSAGNVEFKVINGRKIAVRVPITFEIKAFNNCDINIVKGIMNDENIQTQKIMQNLCTPILVNDTTVELKENIKLNEDNSPIGEILYGSICIINKEYKLSYNKILAKAEAKINVVYIADNEKQTVETFETSLPVMSFIDVEGISENSSISIDYVIKDYCIRPLYQDLQSNAISVEANIDIITYSSENREVELITDFYTPNFIINTESQNNSVLNKFIDVDDKFELTQTLVVPELDNTTILNIDGFVNLNEKTILNGKVAVAGIVDLNVLHFKNDNRIIENKKIELPFQQVIKVENLTKEMEPIVHIDIENIDYSPNGENQLQVKINLLASIVASEETNVNSIINLEVSDENIPIMPSVIIYFVKPGDTLWNIAKTFRSTVEYIMEMNDLKDDIIYPEQRLLIPRLQSNNYTKSLM